MNFVQRGAQIAQQSLKITRDGLPGARDEHIIPSGVSVLWKNLPDQGAQTSFGAVARHCIADFFRGGETNAGYWRVIVAAARLQQKAPRTLPAR